MKQNATSKFLSVFLVVLLSMQGLTTITTPVMAATGTRLGSMTVGISSSVSGNTMTFTASPSTSYTGGSFSYQWQRSTDGGSTWANISGATKSTYSVNTSSLTSKYRFRCNSSYSFTSDESYALINDAYLCFLDRNAESGGNQNWWTQVSNHSINDNAARMTAKISNCPSAVNEAASLVMVIGMSPEAYLYNHPYHNGPQAFISACYKFLLGRDVDAGGLSHWIEVYNQYSANTGQISYDGSTYSTVNEGAVRVINGIAGNAECKNYLASKYSFDASTGKFTYTHSVTYTKSSTYYVDGTSKAITVPEYTITCEDRIGNNTGTLLGTQATKSYTNGHSVSGALWGSDATDNAYYRGYKYSGCSTLTVNGNGKVYRYFTQLPDNVTYDYAQNGGTSISISDNTVYYSVGEDIDLTPVANKDGYTFVGWNTNRNARSGLTSVKNSSSGTTLYAIYRKNLTYTYHTLSAQNDYTSEAYMFNNESKIYSDTLGVTLAKYMDYDGQNLNEGYRYIGYSTDSAKNDNSSLFVGGGEISDTDNLDIYCVYEADGTLEYYDTNQNKMSSLTDSDVIYGTGIALPNQSFTYIAKSYTPSASYQFDGWSDENKIYQAGEVISTTSPLVKLYAGESQIKVSSIVVEPKTSVIHINDKRQLYASILPDDAYNKGIEWSSSNPDIASVDESGIVTANNIGTVTVTATAQDGTELSDSGTVSIAGMVTYDANGGNISGETKAYFLQDEDIDLSKAATKPGYTFMGWNTDKNARAGIESLSMTASEITLYAIYRKDVVYTYHSCDSEKVYQQTAYIFNNESTVYSDEEGRVKATYMSHDVIFPGMPYPFCGYSLSSSVNDTDGLITGGDILEINNADFYGVYEVEGVMEELSVSGARIQTKTDIHYGTVENISNIVFQYILDDYEASSGYQFTGWLYNNQSYEAGASITSSAQQISVQATEEQIMVSSMTISPAKASLRPEEKISLIVSVYPSTALDRSVTYTSSAPEIASVDSNGNVIAHKIGTAVITVSANDGSGITKTCNIDVLGRVTYDFAKNGGTSCSDEYIDGKEGSEVSLSVLAQKDDYDFIGWNVNPDAHIAMTSLSFGDEDIVLYAIYRKQTKYSYHLYDVNLDVEQDVYCFNNEVQYYADKDGTTVATLMSYDRIQPDSRYHFIGYTYKEDASSPEDIAENILFTVGQQQDIYCLYQLDSSLQYYDTQKTLIHEETQTKYASGPKIEYVTFTYPGAPEYSVPVGYRFLGWSFDSDKLSENPLVPGEEYTTTALETKLYAIQAAITTTSVIVTPKFSSIYAGEQTELKADVIPVDALDKSVSWTTSDTSLATVDENGLVSGLKEGKVMITATANDGSGASDTVEVDVSNMRKVVLSGVVKDLEGNSIQNCEVMLTDSKSSVVETVNSDVDGNFKIGAIVFGSYNMAFTYEGKTLAIVDVVIGEQNGKDVIDIRSKSDDTEISYRMNGDVLSFGLKLKREPVPEQSTMEEISEKESNAPVTGDMSPIAMFIVLGLSSMVALPWLFRRKRYLGGTKDEDK